MRLTFFTLVIASSITSSVCDLNIASFPNSCSLPVSFDPIKAAYWTGLPHHRRTPFSVSPDGKSAYLAYLDSTFQNIQVLQVDVDNFEAVGTPVSIGGFEAAGLVAQNDGFALLATVNATGNTDIPPNSYPIVSLIRYKNGVEAWRTPLNGPGVNASEGLTATPDANGDLVYSPASGLYAAYFVVTAYTGYATGHFGDSIKYVDDSGNPQNIPSSSTFGCSHNTGIGFEDADQPPFASVCAEDHGAIWLNTDTQYMSGVKISNENTTNGSGGESMGGMSGSYSNLARFPSTTNYVFAWQSRGALDLTVDTWMGSPYTQCSPRWLNHNVAIATMSNKSTLTGFQATSEVGAAEGDLQINWITYSSIDDHQNVHVAALDSKLAVVTWETLANPACQALPLSCTGTYSGTSFQLIDSTGAKLGSPVTSTKVFVSGDIRNVGTDKICWPYVDITWDLSAPKNSGSLVTKMSFACASTENTPVTSNTSTSALPIVSSAAYSPVVNAQSPGSTPPASYTSSSAPPALIGTAFTMSTTSRSRPYHGPYKTPSKKPLVSSSTPMRSSAAEGALTAHRTTTTVYNCPSEGVGEGGGAAGFISNSTTRRHSKTLSKMHKPEKTYL